MPHEDSASAPETATESTLEFAARLWLRTALIAWGAGGLSLAALVLRRG